MEFVRLNGRGCTEEERSRRVTHVRSIVIPHTEYQKVRRRLERTHQDGKSSPNPKGLFISGDTGVGKTTLFRKYVDQYPREELQTHSRIPVLYIKTPYPAKNTKTMSTEVLFRMGDPVYYTGNEIVQTTRICRLVETCEIELIIIDELQHLIDRETNKFMASVSDWLKRLAEAISIPVVLCGLPECDRIFNYNSQIDDRWTTRMSLRPFPYETNEDKTYFGRFLDEVDKGLPFSDRSYIGEYADQIYYATLGVTRQVMTLLENATEKAALSGEDKILFKHLNWGYQDIIRSRRPYGTNPFVERFSLQESLKLEEDRILHKVNQEQKARKVKEDPDKFQRLNLYHLIRQTHTQTLSKSRTK